MIYRKMKKIIIKVKKIKTTTAIIIIIIIKIKEIIVINLKKKTQIQKFQNLKQIYHKTNLIFIFLQEKKKKKNMKP